MTAAAGRAALVTGANPGMGREYVAQLLDRGVAKVNAAAGNPATIKPSDPRVVALPPDVSATESMRNELSPFGVQVLGVYMALVDTEMAAFAPDSPTSAPSDIVRQVLDAIESGAVEVLADQLTRQARAELGQPRH